METKGAAIELQEKKRSYAPWVRMIAFVLIVALLFGLTGTSFSLKNYVSPEKRLSAGYLLESTPYLSENRFQRLQYLVSNFSAYDLNLQAADYAIGREDYEKAAEFLKKCISTCEDTEELAQLYNKLGCVYVLSDRFEEARSAFNSNIALAVKNPTGYILRAQLEYNLAEAEAAVADSVTYLDKGGSDSDMLLAAALICEACENYAEAVRAMSCLIDITSDTTLLASHCAERGRLYYLLAEEQKAVEDIHRAKKLDKNVLEGVHYAILGLDELRNEDYEASCYDFLKAARLSDKDSEEYYEQAVISAYLMEDNARVASIAAEADAKAQLPVLSLFLWGIALFMQGEYENARTVLDRSIASGSVAPEAYYYRALSALALDDYEAAAGDFGISMERGENVLESTYNRALCYYALERYDEAVEDFKTVIADGSNAALAASAQEFADPFMEAKGSEAESSS